MIQFPEGFLWGAATSAYQVEGNNINSDWWEWEKRAGLKELSGKANRHYEFYKEDFDLARALNHNCHRLSIEWSRIEPEEGKISEEGIAHYREAILSLKQRNLEPIVTLHHFTSPLWFAKLGGWQNKSAQVYFLHFVEKIVGVLCDNVRYWITINEPLVYVYQSYILGLWPPQEKSFLKAKLAADNLASAHINAYKVIHGIYKKKKLAFPLVSIAQSIQAFESCDASLRNRFATFLRNQLFNFEFIKRLIRSRSLDFIGINYYTRGLVDVTGWSLRHLLLDVCKRNHKPLKKNCLGWDIYPEGLYNLLLKFGKYNLPVFVLENGICTENDSERWDFICEHLKNVHRAIGEGVKVLGYVYWSLIDNFEWDKGFSVRFGLIEVDYNTYKRTVRESAYKFSEVCRTGRLD